ncbi:DUF4349 domain-containing protein [Pedobacter antarcticus]|uniref:DUF4349 domain-containing protein n=2 Tax=Pedobacter antarcticus TaxID=34086 RepID=A0A081PBI7_9SPHI|nr:DUF4349 domain-containing protein [Pedobacter antarcticus]KEQ28060.1 hypothetical protein N180_00015 [Pedobacter antarcticus 4BY]SDL44252.1 protein of unknown function [Pedobacter antarcticus]SFE40464.1 protein of unknown function [Pedobacter antarcticus]
MKKIWIAAFLPILLFACKGNNHNGRLAEDAVSQEFLATDSVSGSKISKTSEMRFRVKNVQNTKEKLSEVIQYEGGFLVEASTQSNIVENEKVAYSIDSLLELNSYRTDGLVIARIPADRLDDFTSKVVKMAVFVDFQSIRMEDLSGTFKENSRKTAAQKKATAGMNKLPQNQAQVIDKKLQIEERTIAQQEANRQINAKVAYSTITLNFYQDNKVQRLVTGNDKLSAYKPSFFQRVGLNIVEGWRIFKEVILFITQLWLVILALILLYLAYRQYKARRVK